MVFENPYSGFDPDNQLRPRIKRVDFYTQSGFDLGWLLLEPINIAKSDTHEIELAKQFSPGQKALYFWWFVDAQVTNGGFVQFYYNGYEKYVNAIISGLEYIGDKEMKALITEANEIYLSNKKIIDEAREEDSFGSELYEQLHALSELDDRYYDINFQTMSFIEKYARLNPNEFCVDENGKPYDRDFSGKVESTFDNGTIKEEFFLTKGVIDKEFKTYYETGQIKSLNAYVMGELLGEQKYWYDNGNLERVITINPYTKNRKKEYYFENGQLSKLENLDGDDKRKGEYKKWYQNGQLKEESTYLNNTDRIGEWVKYWENGSKKFEAEFKNGDVYYRNYWNKKGEQLLKEGNGLYINKFISLGQVWLIKTEYKNYKKNGKSKTFIDGNLTLEAEYKDGQQHGKGLSYYDNGVIEEETVYENGVKVSQKKFDKFQDPKIITSIVCEMEDDWLLNRNLEIADTYPVPKNSEDIASSFDIDISFFEGYDQDREFTYHYFVQINSKGEVTDLRFKMADNKKIISNVENSLKMLLFEPARKDGKRVDSYLYVRYKFKLGER